MSKKSKRIKNQRSNSVITGIAWYSVTQWDRLREISNDRESLEETYEEWLQQAENAIHDLKNRKVRVKKVNIDVEELLFWCTKNRVPVDGHSRASFTSHKLKENQEKS